MTHSPENRRRLSAPKSGLCVIGFRQFFARTYCFATIQNVTDRRQTDRQTTQCTKGSTDSTVGQKLSGGVLAWLPLNRCRSQCNGKTLDYGVLGSKPTLALCLSQQSLQYTAFGMGCAPLLQCLGRLSFVPFAGQ